MALRRPRRRMAEATDGGGGSPRRRAAEPRARTDARRWGGRGNSREGSCGGGAVEGKKQMGMGVDNRILFAFAFATSPLLFGRFWIFPSRFLRWKTRVLSAWGAMAHAAAGGGGAAGRELGTRQAGGGGRPREAHGYGYGYGCLICRQMKWLTRGSRRNGASLAGYTTRSLSTFCRSHNEHDQRLAAIPDTFFPLKALTYTDYCSQEEVL